MKAQQTVLCIQDGSDLNYSNLDKCEDLGVIGTNQTGAESRGLHLHSTLAITTDGLPLGVLRAECTASEPKSKKDKRLVSAIPIEEKKTFCRLKVILNMTDKNHAHKKCISIFKRLSEYIDGELDEKTYKEIRIHIKVKECKVCLETLRRTVDLCRNMKMRGVPESLRERLKLMVS